MEKLNLPPFFIGETVEYITGNNMPKNSKHRVSYIYRSECGCWIILINNEIPTYKTSDCELWRYNCCGKLRKNNGPCLNGWIAKSFRSIQEQPAPLLTFEQIKQKEKEEVLILN